MGQDQSQPGSEDERRLQDEEEAEQAESGLAHDRLAPFAAHDRGRAADGCDWSDPLGRQHRQHEIGHNRPAELEQTADQAPEETELVAEHAFERVQRHADGSRDQRPAQHLRQASHRIGDARLHRRLLPSMTGKRATNQRHVEEHRDGGQHVKHREAGDIEPYVCALVLPELLPGPGRIGGVQGTELRHERRRDHRAHEQQDRARDRREYRELWIAAQHPKAGPRHRPTA